MKKSIIALAVAAGAFASVAQADGTTLFGSIRMAYTYTDTGSNEFSTVGNSGSRFGIKGSDDLGNGLTMSYFYETRMSENKAWGGIKTDDLYLSLSGSFGTVLYGTMVTPRDNLSNHSDPSNAVAAGYGRTAITSSSNAAAYATPDMSGFQAIGAVVMNGERDLKDHPVTNGNDHVDAVDVLLQYKANGIYAGLGYQTTNSAKQNVDVSNIGIGLGYENDMFNIGLLVEQADVDGSNASPRFVRLGGAYNISDMDSVYASVSMYDSDVANTDEVFSGMIGYQHKFSKRSRVWAEYGHQGETANNANDDVNVLSVGLRTDF